ncbi:MAG: MOSC domain-containing protein [Halobacteriota archaeon]
MSRVEAIFTTPVGSEPMERVDTVEAVDGGLDGDRYQTGTGYYSPDDVCEVTLIAGEALDEIRDEFDIDLSDGSHRRNLVTRGVQLEDLLGVEFTVGRAVLEGTHPRPPCEYLERVVGIEGTTKSLTEGRSGICADVVLPGPIHVGDAVEPTEE